MLSRIFLATSLCAALVLTLASSPPALAASEHSVRVWVPINASEPGPVVPHEFLGLSFEAGALSQIAGYANDGDLVGLLRSVGPGLLRFGGVTADEQVAWSDPTMKRPAWAASTIDANDFHNLAVLAERSGWHVMLTLGLAHFEPEAAAHEAAAAQAQLGPWLAGIELGNEPDYYGHHGFRTEPWGFLQYEAEVDAYRSAIAAVAPGVALAGPDVSGSGAFETWGLGEALKLKPALLTGHHYPLGCTDPVPPTITGLLSPKIRRAALVSLEKYMSISRSSGIPFRLDETNTVSCGGTAGISNTYASALWAIGYLAQAMDAGVAGINLQSNPVNCGGYTPVCAATAERANAGALGVQPEWYALLMARELVGDRPIAASIYAHGHPNLQISPLLAPDGGMHVVILDYEPPGSPPMRVSLHVGEEFRDATVLSLRGPSLGALSGLTLDGLPVSPEGVWQQPSSIPHRENIGGVITTTVPAASATLVSIAPVHRIATPGA
jgi:hypothetical protein